MKFNSGILLSIAGLLLGAAGDYVRDKQMKMEVREAVNEELNNRMGETKNDH